MIGAENSHGNVMMETTSFTPKVSTELLEFRKKLGMITALPASDRELPKIELPLISELGFFDVRELTKFND